MGENYIESKTKTDKILKDFASTEFEERNQHKNSASISVNFFPEFFSALVRQTPQTKAYFQTRGSSGG